MSTGGIFKLIINSGVQDSLLMATDYLNQRIKTITARNKASKELNDKKGIDPSASWIPDINSIAKSHIIFINGAYKPFVACGFEYNKVAPNGNVQFNSRVSFTIPVFGDFVNDCVIHVKLSALSVKDNRDKVRYIALLGHRIFKYIEFKVNSSVLDSTIIDDYNAFYQFQVPPRKEIGWLRNMGQEIPEIACLTGDPEFDTFKEYRLIGDGFQTFKQRHEGVELWIPLLFWFRNVNNSLPNFAIPYGQTNINIDISPITNLVGFADYGGGGEYNEVKIDTMELYMNNIFLQPEIVNIFCSKFGFSLIRVHTRHTEILNSNQKNVLLNQLKWPTETIYIAFKPLVNLTLSQEWYKSSQLTLNSVKMPVIAKNSSSVTVVNGTTATTNTVSFTYVSGPVLTVGVNDYSEYDLVITSGAGYVSDNIVSNRYTIISNTGGAFGGVMTISGVWNYTTPDTTTVFELFKRELAINEAQYYKESPTITDLEVVAYGITIYQKTHATFYNSYIPYRFGDNINTPKDSGWYMINFAFLPGEHQPSGHINLSRSREFYLNYASTYISKDNKVELLVLCTAINFLLVKSGSAILRYST